MTQTRTSAAGFAGCVGSESNPPTGRQTEWTSIYRFDSIADLRAWMNSRERNDLLNQLGDMLGRGAEPCR